MPWAWMNEGDPESRNDSGFGFTPSTSGQPCARGAAVPCAIREFSALTPGRTPQNRCFPTDLPPIPPEGVTSKALRYALPALLALATSAHAIVIRSDVPDSRYRVSVNAMPALVDLSMEGHGALIARRWVVTAAHATKMMRIMPGHDYVVMAGKHRKVSRIVLYPDYLEVSAKWDALFERMKSDDAASWLADYESVRGLLHDIALIELSEPVEDVQPVALYRGSDEQGRIAEIYGKGATGTSATGAAPDAPHRGDLRRADNRITGANGQWLVYRFDCGAEALPLEGAVGGGDSGGPVLIEHGGQWQLAGLTQGLYSHMADLSAFRAGTFRQGLCGQDFSSSRISHYALWIDSVITSPGHATQRP